MMMSSAPCTGRAECSASIVPGSTDTSWATPPSGPLRGVAVDEESGTIRDVLIERAPQGDVQQLVAPADGEDRDAAVHRASTSANSNRSDTSSIP